MRGVKNGRVTIISRLRMFLVDHPNTYTRKELPRVTNVKSPRVQQYIATYGDTLIKPPPIIPADAVKAILQYSWNKYTRKEFTKLTGYGRKAIKAYVTKYKVAGNDGFVEMDMFTHHKHRIDNLIDTRGYKGRWNLLCIVGQSATLSCSTHGEFTATLGNTHTASCFGCKACSRKGVSTAENDLAAFVASLMGVDNVNQSDRSVIVNPKNNREMELGITIPSKYIAIEYNGLLWHSSYVPSVTRNTHRAKEKLCRDAGYRLIQVFEDDWLLRRGFIERLLTSVLTPTTSKYIQARVCDLRIISYAAADAFLSDNHIQGGTHATLYLGAFNDGALIGVGTFNKHVGKLELTRFSTSCTVPNLLRRMCINAMRMQIVNSVYTFCDTSLFSGDSYSANGFTKVSRNEPIYSYVAYTPEHQMDVRHHARRFTREYVSSTYGEIPRGISVPAFLHTKRVYKIWDVGKVRYELNI